MRLREYRAWIKPGKMVYDVVPFQWDYCINRMFHKCISSNGSGFFDSGGSAATFELNGYSYVTEDKGCLMEFIGRKDTKGTKVYEGDIFIVNANDDEWYSVVEWRNNLSRFELNNYKNPASDISLCEAIIDEEAYVVGNTFEHHHLLEPTN